MTGEEIFKQLSVRDQSGSKADEYAKTLNMLRLHASLDSNDEKFFALLERAEKEGKKLDLPGYREKMLDGYPVSDFIIV